MPMLHTLSSYVCCTPLLYLRRRRYLIPAVRSERRSPDSRGGMGQSRYTRLTFTESLWSLALQNLDS